MPIRDFFGVMRRRWAIVLVGFLLTVGLSGAAYWFSKPTYEITGTVLLLPPESAAISGPINPYLELSGLQQLLDLVGVSLSDQSTQLELQAISKDVDYTVKADVRTSSPLLMVDVKDSNPATAQQIRDLLMQRIPARLESMQSSLNVTVKDRVTSTVVTLDAQAEEVGKNRLRAGVVAGVAGLAVTLLVAALWDTRRLRRGRRVITDAPAVEMDEVTHPAPAEQASVPGKTLVTTQAKTLATTQASTTHDDVEKAEPHEQTTGRDDHEPHAEDLPRTSTYDQDEVPISPVSALGDLEALEEGAHVTDDAVR